MRRNVVSLAAIAICLALQGGGQQPHPHDGGPPPLVRMLVPPGKHARPAQANEPKTPEVVLDASNLGSPIALGKGWRVGISANQDIAKPDFDDSTWAVRDAIEEFADVEDEDHVEGPSHGQGKPGSSVKSSSNGDDDEDSESRPEGHRHPFAWFRLHVKLAANHGPIALLVELPVSRNTSISFGSQTGPGFEVFVNGKQINPEGPHGDAPEHYQKISRLYRLNVDPSETSLTLVLRTLYRPVGYGSYTSFFHDRKLLLGNPDDLNHSLELWSIHGLFERLPKLVTSVLLVVLSLFLLALYFSQKGHPEYLWLALYELLQAPIGFFELAGSSARLDSLWYAAVVLQLLLISAYLYFEFIIAFLTLRRRWYIQTLRWTAPILGAVGPILLFVGHSTVIGIMLAIVLLGSLLWILGWNLFIAITLIAAAIRRNFEAGLLLIPLILSLVGVIEPVLTAGNDMGAGAYRSPLTIQAGPIPIHFASIADFTGILVIVLIIFVRFLRIQRDRERASSELAAARSVQELMIPHERVATPGFEVQSIYNPATEVGGDFFHVESTGDGGLLVVIGDVAGHGLKAAMNVSMLMGALRRIQEKSPAKILESLNRVLVGSDSFTTCQAAWFGPNGELILANAGHLSPYLNSQEVAIPGGLPLGVLLDVSYEEVQLYLHPGDRILLMSDGVVEARQASGELFGFDRVHNLSNQSAFYIADAAKAFGQEDDITVVTVRRLAQAMAA